MKIYFVSPLYEILIGIFIPIKDNVSKLFVTKGAIAKRIYVPFNSEVQ